jgi:hypothetical protein
MTNAVYNAQCQYLGSGSTACGSPSVVSKSYCVQHVWLVYKEGSNILRRKDTKRYDFLSQLVSDFNAVAEELEAEGWTPEWDGSVDQRR